MPISKPPPLNSQTATPNSQPRPPPIPKVQSSEGPMFTVVGSVFPVTLSIDEINVNEFGNLIRKCVGINCSLWVSSFSVFIAPNVNSQATIEKCKLCNLRSLFGEKELKYTINYTITFLDDKIKLWYME
jgi:hypothetical protein